MFARRLFVILFGLLIVSSGGCRADTPTAPDADAAPADKSDLFPAEDLSEIDQGERAETPRAGPKPCEERRDRPDSDHEDRNCDGIDGDKANSIFVSPTGSDDSSGKFGSPKRTINAGVQAAARSQQRSWVLVRGANFEGQIQLEPGVHVVGGYGFGWSRESGGRTVVSGESPVLKGDGIDRETVVSDLGFRATEPIPEGKTTITAYLQDSNNIVFKNVRLVGGVAQGGADGADGSGGKDGGDGQSGDNGAKDGGVFCPNSPRPEPGNGGRSSCGADGGDGGSPGKGEEEGTPGESASSQVQGGQGGRVQMSGRSGEAGLDGSNGDAGRGALSGGHFDNWSWRGHSGERGQTGTNGTAGAGGGGGGGGGSGFLKCPAWGGAGGGGGAGGCGGEPGEGGKPGGAAVTLFLSESRVQLINSRLEGGTGGTGGRGGRGGAGGVGGEGGSGGAAKSNSGAGGAGGDGGDGGRGGAGGGGAGGPAFTIYSTEPFDESLVDSKTKVIKGTPGAGGLSPSFEAKGEAGEVAKIKSAPQP